MANLFPDLAVDAPEKRQPRNLFPDLAKPQTSVAPPSPALAPEPPSILATGGNGVTDASGNLDINALAKRANQIALSGPPPSPNPSKLGQAFDAATAGAASAMTAIPVGVAGGLDAVIPDGLQTPAPTIENPFPQPTLLRDKAREWANRTRQIDDRMIPPTVPTLINRVAGGSGGMLPLVAAMPAGPAATAAVMGAQAYGSRDAEIEAENANRQRAGLAPIPESEASKQRTLSTAIGAGLGYVLPGAPKFVKTLPFVPRLLSRAAIGAGEMNTFTGAENAVSNRTGRVNPQTGKLEAVPLTEGMESSTILGGLMGALHTGRREMPSQSEALPFPQGQELAAKGQARQDAIRRAAAGVNLFPDLAKPQETIQPEKFNVTETGNRPEVSKPAQPTLAAAGDSQPLGAGGVDRAQEVRGEENGATGPQEAQGQGEDAAQPAAEVGASPQLRIRKDNGPFKEGETYDIIGHDKNGLPVVELPDGRKAAVGPKTGEVLAGAGAGETTDVTPTPEQVKPEAQGNQEPENQASKGAGGVVEHGESVTKLPPIESIKFPVPTREKIPADLAKKREDAADLLDIQRKRKNLRHDMVEKSKSTQQAIEAAVKGKRGKARDAAKNQAIYDAIRADKKFIEAEKSHDAAQKAFEDLGDEVHAHQQGAEKNRIDQLEADRETTKEQFRKYPWWELEHYSKANTPTPEQTTAGEVLDEKIAAMKEAAGLREGEVLAKKEGKAGPPPRVNYRNDAAKLNDKGYIPPAMVHEAEIAKRGKTPAEFTTEISTDDDIKHTARIRTSSDKTRIAKLKEFVRAVPEFALDPKFTVVGEADNRMLQFQDGGKFKFFPEAIGVTFEREPKTGETIGIDPEIVKKLKNDQVLIVRNSESAPAKSKLSENNGRILGYGASGKSKTSPFLGDRSFVKEDVVPTASAAVRGFRDSWRWLKRTFAPHTLSETAARGGESLIARLGEQTQRQEQVRTSLAQAHKFFDRRTTEQNYDFIDRFQAGQKQADASLNDVAQTWKKINEDQVQRMQALGDDVLKKFEENHIKQIWKESQSDPAKVEGVIAKILAKRPLEGSKGFLKKKTYATYKEGRDAGLTPLFDNPVDAMLYGFDEAEKFIQMRKFANEYRHGTAGVYVGIGDKVPDGFKVVDDPAFHVYGGPTVEVNEYVNKSVWEALNAVGKNLKLDISTKMTLPKARGAAGYMQWGTPETVRRFGTDLGVLGHEISHQLDAKYDLQKIFLQPKYAEEMRALADLHGYKKQYFRKGEEKIASLLEAYVTAPESFRQNAPSVYRDFTAWMEQKPELYPIVELERGLGLQKLSSEMYVPGIRKLGSYAVPADMADLVMNHLKPGLRNNPLFRGFMYGSNVLNHMQLAGFFHVGFTSADAAISKFALGIEQIANGKPFSAVRSMALSPFAPFSNAYYGHQLIQEYLKPGTFPEMTPVVSALVEGGARIHQSEAYRFNTRQNMMRAFRRGNLLGGIVRIPGAALDALGFPTMEKLVPMQKWGVMGDLMKEELGKLGPNPSPVELRRASRKVVSSVENRMGQVVYDNLFMDRKAKDLLMALMRSVGWNMGTFKELGGSLTEAPKDLLKVATGKGFDGHKLPYTLALLTLTGFAGGLYQYLKTEEYPKELKDFYYPKVGRKDEEGNDIRVQLPTYMRDIGALFHGGIDKVPSNFAEMAGNKTSPMIAMLMQLIRNRDYYDTRITDPKASAGEKLKDRAKFVAKSATPFTVQSFQKQGEDVPLNERIAATLGVTPAPKRFTRSEAENLASEYAAGEGSKEARTPEQVERSKLKRDLAAKLRDKSIDARPEIYRALREQRIRPTDMRDIIERSRLSPLQFQVKNLNDPEQAMRVYEVATDKEKDQIRNEVLAKIINSKSLLRERKRELIARVRRAKAA